MNHASQKEFAMKIHDTMIEDFKHLKYASRQLYDVQQSRIRAENRLRAMIHSGRFEPEFRADVDQLSNIEGAMAKTMVRQYRAVVDPRILQWQQDTVGIGEKLLARLMGELQHPVIYVPMWWEEGEDGEGKRVLMVGEPQSRGVRELWAYTGHGDPERKRFKGMSQEHLFALGNPLAKMLAHLLAQACVMYNGAPDKKGNVRPLSPYRWLYDASRQEYSTRADWTPLRQKNAAERKVAKAILKDLWRVTKGQEPAFGNRTEWTPRAA
jgi:hypothetical protein